MLSPMDDQSIESMLSSLLFQPSLKERYIIPRLRLRQAIVEAWQIQPGQKLLDIGCGQGESTVCLAYVVGPSGKVTGIDYAPDYGWPYTVKESHEFTLNSPLGSRLAFHHGDLASYLEAQCSTISEEAVLLQCLWYFPSAESVKKLFRQLAKAKCRRIFLSEYSHAISSPAQLPSKLASQAQALYYGYRQEQFPTRTEVNVRAGMEQEMIMNAAHQGGYVETHSGTLQPDSSFLEPHLEAKFVCSPGFRKKVDAEGLLPEQREEILAFVPRVEAALEQIGEDHQHSVSMHIWWVVLDLA